MHKLTVSILAVCFGILIPAAAMPVRVCLLESAAQTEDCCGTCSTKEKDCCVYQAGIPDAPLPQPGTEIPPVVTHAIPTTMVELPGAPVRDLSPPCLAQAPSGIGRPTAPLAVLNVWRM